MTTLSLLVGRDPASPLDVVRFGGHDHILFDRRVALCDRPVPQSAVSVEDLVDWCPDCDRLHAELERRRTTDRRIPAARLKVL